MRNTVPYKAIAKKITRQGFSRIFKQCREKVKPSKRKKEVIVSNDQPRTPSVSEGPTSTPSVEERWPRTLAAEEGQSRIVFHGITIITIIDGIDLKR